VPGFKLIKPHTNVAYNLVLQDHLLPLRKREGAKHSFTDRLTAPARHLRSSSIQRGTEHAGRNKFSEVLPRTDELKKLDTWRGSWWRV
jgi:hypothetical protein